MTADGLLEPLGFSQVVRVVEGLAARDWSYTILSLEKPDDLVQTGKVAALERRLSQNRIRWVRLPYDWRQNARAAASNVATLAAHTIRLAREVRAVGVHARAYHGAFAALGAWASLRTPYLFDTRSYWFDERIEEGRWFTSPMRRGFARGVERQLFSRARAVVTLTELQADDVRHSQPAALRQRVIRCIPTCADYAEFRPRELSTLTSVPVGLRNLLSGKLVIGIIGSINRSYLVDETLSLVRAVLSRRPDAWLLVLSGQREAYTRAVRAVGIDEARTSIVKVDHGEMPEWLSLIHWGMLLLRPGSRAKRASMPTKLAEFFASGVRPVHYGCNEEVSGWVRAAGSGFSLADVQESTLLLAAERISTSPLLESDVQLARSATAEHFSLSNGIERYNEVLEVAFGSS